MGWECVPVFSPRGNMHRVSPTREAPGHRGSNDVSQVQRSATPGKQTLSEALPAVQASTRPGAAAVTATGPGGTPEAGPIQPGTRPSLRSLFGPPSTRNDGDAGG